MAKLTTAQRKAIPKNEYGLPSKKTAGGAGRGGYPMPDRSHAANAKARAKQQLDKGDLSRAQYNQIVTKANKVLGEGSNNKKVKQAGSMLRRTAGV